MNQLLFAIVAVVLLFVGMLVLLEVGRWLGQRAKAYDEQGARAGLGAVDGAVFGLMGLLIAFTFSRAATQFDTRRQMIAQEANAIGTAWLRLDLLPPGSQPEMRELFRRYLDSRLAVFEKIPDMKAVDDEEARTALLQAQIWARGTAACRQAPDPLTAQVIPALNEMFDVAALRSAGARIHPPAVIFVMLGMLALISALLAGYGMAGGRARSWIHMVGFGLIMAATVYVILDLEYPRRGFIRIDRFDQVLLQLRQSMN
jgi:hypothetical protein